MQVAETLEMSFTNMLLNNALKQNQYITPVRYVAALYLRLSRDDNNGDAESMSIQSQKQMLITYAQEHGYTIGEIYVDDGYTGTNFERPDFKRMINDIKIGKVNMVITKDLSRLGRNYVMIGQYRDYFFPEYNVRYVAINDGYDSNKEDNDIAPFKDILNEMYAKDISKKIRSSRKVAAQNGKFMGSNPSYGYKRSDEDKHKLVVDESAAKVVKRIYELFKNHESARRIADILNKEGIMTPQNHYYQLMGQENPYKKNANTWCSTTVISLLQKEVYLGHIVQSKRAVQSFKSKKLQVLPPEMWVIVENTHEAIIDRETWNAVQLLFETNKKSKSKKSANEDVSLFTNIVRCKSCNSKLSFSTRQIKSKVDSYYRCSRYIQHGKEACSPHRITLDILYSVVLEDIKRNARLALADEEMFVKQLHQISLEETHSELADFVKQEAYFKNRLYEVDNLIQKAFEKNVNGVLPDSMLANLLKKYEADKKTLDEDLINLKRRKLIAESQTTNIQREIDNLKKYAEITELNRTVVTNLIHSIHISEPKTVDGKKTYDIDIRYKFQNPHKDNKAQEKNAKKEDTLLADKVSSL